MAARDKLLASPALANNNVAPAVLRSASERAAAAASAAAALATRVAERSQTTGAAAVRRYQVSSKLMMRRYRLKTAVARARLRSELAGLRAELAVARGLLASSGNSAATLMMPALRSVGDGAAAVGARATSLCSFALEKVWGLLYEILDTAMELPRVLLPAGGTWSKAFGEAIYELRLAATSLAGMAYSASRAGATAVAARLGVLSGACVRLATRLRVLLLETTGGLRARLSGGAAVDEEEEGPAEQEPPPTPLPA